jgi:hypothetical protein
LSYSLQTESEDTLEQEASFIPFREKNKCYQDTYSSVQSHVESPNSSNILNQLSGCPMADPFWCLAVTLYK